LSPLQSTNQFDALISFNNGTTYWDFGNVLSSGGRHTMPNPPGTIGNWMHYALVASQSGNAMRIYTNGVLASSKVGMTPFVRGSYELGIGGLSGYFFNGRLNEFRVWNTVRSQAQIQASLSTSLVGNEAGLLLYYKLNSSSGTVATNSATATGAAYNGTLRNGAQWVSSTPLSNVVTRVNDDGMGSLRSAVALTLPGGVITFATNLSDATITLTNGQLLIQNNLTIDASALADRVTISGNNASRVLMISNNATVVLKSLDISGGRVAYFQSGAGIYNFTNCSLTLTNCTIQGNQVSSANGANCGGFYNAGTATLLRCQISNNGASGASGASGTGGGIYNVGTATLTECLVSSNSALGALGAPSGTGGTGAGAGIYNLGRRTLNRCTLQNNDVGGGDGRSTLDNPGGPALGGGLYNAGYATLTKTRLGKIPQSVATAAVPTPRVEGQALTPWVAASTTLAR